MLIKTRGKSERVRPYSKLRHLLDLVYSFSEMWTYHAL